MSASQSYTEERSTWKKLIQLGEKVPLMLTATERKLILEDVMSRDQDYEEIVRNTPSGMPVTITLDEA